MKKYLLLLFLLPASGFAQVISLEEARKLTANEQLESASSVFKQLAQQQATNGDVFYYFGKNMLNAFDADSAELLFKRGITSDPANALNEIGLARIDIINSNLTTGRSKIEAAVKKSGGKKATILMEAGEALISYREKDLLVAQGYLEAAQKLEPKNPEVYNYLGDLFREMSNGTQAATNYNKSLELDKNQPKPLLHKGQMYKRATNYEGALAEFDKALELDSKFAPALREKAETYYLMRKPEKAKEFYRQYLEISKNNTGARLRFASFLFQSEDYKEAYSIIQPIQPVDSNNLNMMRIYGYLYYENAENDKSLSCLNRVFSLTQTDTVKRIDYDYAYMGKALAKAGREAEGASFVRTAYERNKKNPELLSDLGNLYMKSKQYDLAAMSFEERINTGIKVTTTDYFNLGKAYYQGKQYGKADTAFARVNEVQATWAPGYLWRGRANTGLDPETKLGLAKPHYEKYIELAEADAANASKYKKDLAEAKRYLGYYYLVQKDCEKSLGYWNGVISLDPENEQAKEIIQQIKTNPANCK